MKWFLYLLTIVLIVLHQDFWNWNHVGPLWFGFLPVGLWYHLLYCVAAAVLMALFVVWAWPTQLEHVQREVPGPEQTPAH